MHQAIDQNQLVRFAQNLVQYASLSGGESAVAIRVKLEMERLGYDEIWTDANGSVVGIIQGALPGRTLLLDGHIDTVGIAATPLWSQDPYGGALVDGALYGRGSADMKGAVAAMVHAAAAVDRQQLHGRVAVSATTLEEVLEGVALATVMARVQPDCVVIGEATELNLNRGGRGRAELHLTVLGRPAHSSSPQLGRSAVMDMVKLITAIDALPLPSHPLLGPASMALTDIVSAPYPGHSVIPSRCQVTYDRRLLPSETPEQVLAPLRALARELGIELEVTIAEGQHQAYTRQEVTGEKFFPAWEFPAEHWFVQAAVAGLQQTGLTPQIGAYRFCTNGAHSAGMAGVPTVGFGPAAEGDAHVVDERLRLVDLFAAAQGYQGIIAGVLGA